MKCCALLIARLITVSHMSSCSVSVWHTICDLIICVRMHDNLCVNELVTGLLFLLYVVFASLLPFTMGIRFSNGVIVDQLAISKRYTSSSHFHMEIVQAQHYVLSDILRYYHINNPNLRSPMPFPFLVQTKMLG